MFPKTREKQKQLDTVRVGKKSWVDQKWKFLQFVSRSKYQRNYKDFLSTQFVLKVDKFI
jgi:hypothetical protein